jgi:NADPH:quinone reductase-like Zn-dependent oxidoreductase
MLQGKNLQRCGHCLIASSVYHSANAPSGNRSIRSGSQRRRTGSLEIRRFAEACRRPGEVVIDVVAASVNGADWKVRAGQYKQSTFPLALGRDFSGVISAIGEGVTDFKVGDDVFGVCEAGQEGAYAEKIAVKAAIVAKKPAALSHIHAAALALTGLTAMSAIGWARRSR